MISNSLPQQAASYGQITGFIYVFNLIVGTGALTLPAAFQHAGWMLSTLVLLALAFMSYVTLTFVVESMAVANAVLRSKRRGDEDSHSYDTLEDSGGLPQDRYETEAVPRRKMSTPSHSPRHQPLIETADVTFVGNPEDEPLVPAIILTSDDGDEICDIRETVEMIARLVTDAGWSAIVEREVVLTNFILLTLSILVGAMARLFFNKFGTSLFFLCMCIYLYGDLAIYGTAVSKTMTDVVCTHLVNGSCNATITYSDPCFDNSTLTRFDIYRIILGVFSGLLGPFVFFNVQKTKYLQMVTLLMRWTAFLSMIALSVQRLMRPPVGETPFVPAAISWGGLPNLFGVCVYSFMCHHSLPSLITPISNKRSIYTLLSMDYTVILAFYLLLSLTGVFAFRDISDLYTLNFVPDRCDLVDHTLLDQIFHYFLALFPVFTLSTSFPIIAITLRNNLKSLFLTRADLNYNRHFVTFFFPLLALFPPLILAFCTYDLQALVGITGSYAGAGIQYFIPAFLVHSARKVLSSKLRVRNLNNPYRSPFSGTFWVFVVVMWALGCVGFVTYNHVVEHV